MKHASKFFSDFERTRIEQAVTDAEAKTDAEIVPAVATSSGRYDRAEDIFGLWVGLAAMSVLWFVLHQIGEQDSQWGAPWTRFELPLLIAAAFVGFLVGVAIATMASSVRKPFISGKEMRDSVNQAATHVFFDNRIHHTQASTGILIYLSLYERTVTLRADQKALDSLGQETIDTMCATVVQGIRKGDAATALCELIEDLGARLAELIPKTDGNANELGNALIVID